jgi:hypothetical protein
LTPYLYDALGRVEATVFTLTTRFTYDGDGAWRVVEVVGQGTTTYTVDYAAGNRILAEETITGAITYLYGHDCLGQYDDAEDEWLYYLNDATGYVRQGADEQGQVVSSWLFDPDGTVLEGPEGLVSHLICGGVYDWSTGLIFKGGRYFDPSLGIWLALIPLVLIQSWRGRKKRRRGVPWYMLVIVGVGGVLTACGEGTPPPGDTPTPEEVCTDTPELPTETPEPPTPTPTPRPKTQWEIDYGEAIARAAHDLLSNADNYHIWGAFTPGHENENYVDPPLRHPPQPDDTWWNYGVEIDVYQRTGGRIPIVCADVIALSYEGGGLSLYTFTEWADWGDHEGARWESDPTRYVPSLKILLQDHHQLHQLSDGTLPELGDMVLRASIHSAVVAEITGDDANQIFVIEASYPNDTIRKVSLAEWAIAATYFGHPRVPGS